jgi:hypothetical protein
LVIAGRDDDLPESADCVEKLYDSATALRLEAFFQGLRADALARGGRVAASSAAYAATASIDGAAGRNRARRRRFRAVAASRNSSLAPHGPRSRKRPSLKLRLRWANSISTFFRRASDLKFGRRGKGPRHITRVFTDAPRNLARDVIRAAPRFEIVDVAILLARAITTETVSVDAGARRHGAEHLSA